MTGKLSFSYLWDGSQDGWVLYQPKHRAGTSIYNRIEHRALIIEEDDVLAEVIEAMRTHGVEVLEELQ